MTTKATTPAAKKAAKEAAQTYVNEPQKASNNIQAIKKTRPPANTKLYNKQALEEIAAQGLPPYITAWEFSPNPYDEDTTILTFYVDDEPVTYVEVNADNLEELMSALSEHMILLAKNEVTGWFIRKPEDSSLPPILSLTSGGGVISSLPLDKDILKQMVPALLKLYDPNKGKGGGFMRWAKKHYIVSGTTGILLGFGLIVTIVNFTAL